MTQIFCQDTQPRFFFLYESVTQKSLITYCGAYIWLEISADCWLFFYPIICLTKTLLVLLTLYTTTVDLKHKINLFRNYRHICLRSSDWLGHWIISYFLNPRNSWVAFLACFGLLSICTVKCCLISLAAHFSLPPYYSLPIISIQVSLDFICLCFQNHVDSFRCVFWQARCAILVPGCNQRFARHCKSFYLHSWRCFLIEDSHSDAPPSLLKCFFCLEIILTSCNFIAFCDLFRHSGVVELASTFILIENVPDC